VNSTGSEALSTPRFVNNTVIYCNQGVWIDYRWIAPVIRNNIFVETSNALLSGGGVVVHLDASYNCFVKNRIDFSGFPGSYGIPVINNHNGDPCDAFNNIFLNPRFSDTNRFLLQGTSPCIDAGDPAITDVCPGISRGTLISDIGAYGGSSACGWLAHGFAPILTMAPHDQMTCIGGSASFIVTADGVGPLTYQWYYDRTNLLAGATNAQLEFADVRAFQAGLYSLTVSNPFGTTASPPARLEISDACVGIGLYSGLSITGLVGRAYAIDATTNLATQNWVSIATNTFSQPRWLFIDTNTPLIPARMFRVRLQP